MRLLLRLVVLGLGSTLLVSSSAVDSESAREKVSIILECRIFLQLRLPYECYCPPSHEVNESH